MSRLSRRRPKREYAGYPPSSSARLIRAHTSRPSLSPRASIIRSGNPGGRPKGVIEVITLARAQTRAAIRALADIMQHGRATRNGQ
jgi:hypothetical protein